MDLLGQVSVFCVLSSSTTSLHKESRMKMKRKECFQQRNQLSLVLCAPNLAKVFLGVIPIIIHTSALKLSIH